MKVSFKNVGQGDSIIIEWEIDNVCYVGIIDCHGQGEKNVVKKYLQSNPYTKISFLVLSHPHFDHISGALELLNYCEESCIIIEELLFTFGDNPYWIKWRETTNAGNYFDRLCDKIDKLIKPGDQQIILQYGSINVGNEFTICESPRIALRCLSPSGVEEQHFYSGVKFYDPSSKSDEGNGLANRISTLFILYSARFYFLFTSDCTTESFERIKSNEKIYKSLCDRTLLGGQVPHHGSIKNHTADFWIGLCKKNACSMVISSGQNKKYKHPDLDVVKFFEDNGFKIYPTNIVHGVVDYKNYLTGLGNALDQFAPLAVPEGEGRDRVFMLDLEKGVLSPEPIQSLSSPSSA